MDDEIGTLIEPEPVQFTWEAPGWYVLGVMLFVVTVVITILIVRHYRRNRYRREAIAWLVNRQKDLMDQPPHMIVYDATMLMKRIVISRYGRRYAAARGGEWITFLNTCCRRDLFSPQDDAWITQCLYVGHTSVGDTDIQAYLNKTRTWIKSHRYAL